MIKRICKIPHDIYVVYKIFNCKTAKRYIGSTHRYSTRHREHSSALENGRYYNAYLQRSFNKHGLNAFVMRPIEIVASANDILEREQYWIDKLKKRGVYNRSLVAGMPLHARKKVYSIDPSNGRKCKYESCAEASLAMTGSRDGEDLIRKAASRLRMSRGIYWTYSKSATLESICEKQAARRNQKENEKPFCVFAFYKDGKLAYSFRSIGHAAEFTNTSYALIIGAMRSRKYRTAGGFTWNDKPEAKEVKCTRTKPVRKVKDGRVLAEYISCKIAASETDGANYKGISSAATGYTKSHAGYQWEFAKT